VNKIQRQRWTNGKRKIARRLSKAVLEEQQVPMLCASNIHYEMAGRSHGIANGGIGSIHMLARKIGLIDAIDQRLHLLKIHLPYHESDHVLNIAYNMLCGGTCLEDIELRRNDVVFLDALEAERIPDPTTEGDFCRRFEATDVLELQEAYDEVRLRVWREQPAEFFSEAVIDMDGTLVATTGQCKEGMDIAYDGTWGYHPLVLTLANTGEVLLVWNRSGNRPSHEGATEATDDAIQLCLKGGFQRIVLRGDTDFTQTRQLDRWSDDPRIRFIFGIDAMPVLTGKADDLPQNSWRKLCRRVKHKRHGEPRRRRKNVKEEIVRQREFENIRLQSEEIAEFEYQPAACKKTYRMVVVRKNLSVERGEQALFDDIRYFFYITNDRTSTAEQIVFRANARCNQENVIEQLKNGARALLAPLDNLVSNWAYMAMASLSWNLKAWWALMLPERPGRWSEKHRLEKETVLRMEFKKFLNSFMQIPCQIVRTGRRILYRMLAWSPWHPIFFRAYEVLRC
jgi:hypothetical protein